jgi:hypothetical protein
MFAWQGLEQVARFSLINIATIMQYNHFRDYWNANKNNTGFE